MIEEIMKSFNLKQNIKSLITKGNLFIYSYDNIKSGTLNNITHRMVKNKTN